MVAGVRLFVWVGVGADFWLTSSHIMLVDGDVNTSGPLAWRAERSLPMVMTAHRKSKATDFSVIYIAGLRLFAWVGRMEIVLKLHPQRVWFYLKK